MPELPEVETIRRYLQEGREGVPGLTGRRILSARLYWGRTLAIPSPEEFQRRLPGQTIQGFGRRGKFLLAHLTADTLLFHLRMSGDMLVRPSGGPTAPHDRLVLELEGGLEWAFNDTRKFGRVWLVVDPQDVLGSLGPEPFDPALDAAAFYDMMHARRRQLKPLLLDQTFLAGLGNIYTDEALHRARLHPLALSDTVSPEQAARLLESIRAVLREGIRTQGASIDWVYRGGDFQNYFRVYKRTGEPCPVCGSPVVRILVGQRSTHYCPTCQSR